MGRPMWRSFDPRDTGAGELTYASAVDDKGIVYSANEAGLQSYDGVSWRLLPHTPQSRGITSILALDRAPWLKGSWLTGGSNGLGIYTPDNTGLLNWTPINLPGRPGISAEESPATVHRLVAVEDAIYIISNAGVFTLDADGVSEPHESSSTGLHTGFSYIDDDAVVFEVEDGLIKMTKDNYHALTLPPRWSELTPVAVFNTKDLGQILVTERSGVFVLETSDSSLTLSPLWDEIPPPLDSAKVLASAALQTGGLIFGTNAGALLHFSLSGRLITRLDSRAGFHAGPVRSISTGPADNVFGFFDGGAVWFNTNDPLRVWDILNGLEKPVTAVAVDSNRVYAGTTAGLYQSVSNGRMRHVPELGDVPIRSLYLFQRSSMRGHTSLIISTARRLVDYADNGVTTLYEGQPSAVFISRTQPTRIAVGFSTLVRLFDFDRSEWTDVGPLGTAFKSPITDFTETADGDLLVVLKDGSVISFAADEWLKGQNLEQAKPLWTQPSPRHPGFDAAPHFSATPDTIRLFMTGAALQWDYKNARFQTDTSLATEFSRLSYPEFPRWYAAKQTAEALWLQTSTGSYVMPTKLPETTPEIIPSLIALPIATRGTASYSDIAFYQRTDRMMFATADGLTSYPRQVLLASTSSVTASQAKPSLPALHIRKIVVDDQTVYDGNGSQPQITVRSTNDEVLLHLAVLDWQTACSDGQLIIESAALPNTKVAVGPDCTATIAINDFANQTSDINLRLMVDGQTVTQDARLNIKISRPLISSPLLPVILGVALGLWVIFNRLSATQAWPESIQRYAALTSGLFILLAIAQVLGISIAPDSVLSAIAIWLGVLFIAFVVPVFAEILLQASARVMTWKT